MLLAVYRLAPHFIKINAQSLRSLSIMAGNGTGSAKIIDGTAVAK